MGRPSDSSDLEEVLDMETVSELLGLDTGDRPNLLDRLIAIFQEDSPPLLEAIAQTHADGDARGLARAAHQLKGSAGAMGARQVQELAARAERAANQGDLAAARDAVNALPQAYKRAIAALAAFVD